jgi:hypothetical protein
LEDAELGEIETYNLTYPDGNPWVGDVKVKLTERDTPFDWPEIHVPTPEELGLVRDFPIITGAPEGK